LKPKTEGDYLISLDKEFLGSILSYKKSLPFRLTRATHCMIAAMILRGKVRRGDFRPGAWSLRRL